ncbi:MAG TPA: tRNA uridine-5-carboxymethylaminomethyl(34) synthesis GTPase MnmE [Candidatus Aphodocola excrementigallinarum]|uniref:tRNA modification GTPase MnmE n=1 Tax=Candidatus Aphodocola excrementigallinarum TaxID=2840670 RepID=A0A9D1LIL4_9FIRM|nr:tRNA uridine-5-carboxymethylaminomethyl(34) synthesis GTPase MnmE [Candidatus Aphodocola excrementigallinarum]
MNDTIVAISTALGEGAISIIRVSGDDAIKIVNGIFKGKDLSKVDSHTINYGHIIYKDEIIDEVLVSVMRSPKTYTKEDVIEINTHGSIAVVNKIMEILLLSGCRLAEPGEFTKRAFLNGRIDLTEAEGVMDLINSETELTRKMAVNELSGKVSKLITDLREKIVALISNIEVNIDYPEYEDIEVVTIDRIKKEVKEMKEELTKILKLSEDGKILKDGIKTVILGKPNVGKSSLLNALLEENKAIVTDVKGTTRDIVEGSIIVGGVKLNLIDTAGVRKSSDVVEKIGIEKSLSLIDEAELILLVLDSSEELTEEDKFLLDKTKDKKRIVIMNKDDLENNNKYNEDVIRISAKTNQGIDLVKDKIKELFNANAFLNKNLTYFTNVRQITILKQAIESLNDAYQGVLNNSEIDMIEIDLKLAWERLGDIIGANYTEELIDNLFSRFCLGK